MPTPPNYRSITGFVDDTTLLLLAKCGFIVELLYGFWMKDIYIMFMGAFFYIAMRDWR